MGDAPPNDGPSPTIVGPRPAGEGAGRRADIPRGIEQLVTLAGVSPDWRETVLADPVAAAEAGDIVLSDSERSILASVPRTALEGMIDRFARSQGRTLRSVAADAGKVAAAALLATSLTTGCFPSLGSRPDAPPEQSVSILAAPPVMGETEVRVAVLGSLADVPPEARPLTWSPSFEEALALAKEARQPVMAVFMPPPGAVVRVPMPVAGVRIDPEQMSRFVVTSETPALRKAVHGAALIPVRVTKPAAPKGSPSDEAKKKLAKAAAAYDALVKKHKVAFYPTVLFLAPDGSELHRVVQPAQQRDFVTAINQVPPLMSRWLTAHRLTSRPTTRPVSRGISPDIPKKRG